MHSRIFEHSKQRISVVHNHMLNHGGQHINAFTWSVLCTERHFNTRFALEALFIHKFNGNLMNGTKGINLLPSLL